MQATTMARATRRSTQCVGNLANHLSQTKNKSVTDWIIDQLDVHPYQHILEIGYASGYTLYEVARKLKIGFLAGIDESVTMYRQAYRRNKKLIADQLLQLHIGSIHELPYPHHYFHTIYGSNARLIDKELLPVLIQLVGLLKSGGKMAMIFQPTGVVDEKGVKQFAERIKQDYLHAGFRNIQIEFGNIHPASCIAVTGFKD